MERMTKKECMKEAMDDVSPAELESLWAAIKHKDLSFLGSLTNKYFGHAVEMYEDQFTSEIAQAAAVDEEIKRRKMSHG
jgi:hypothetical protein